MSIVTNYNIEKFKVHIHGGFYISPDKVANYLWHDLTVHDLCYEGAYSKRYERGYYKTREEAEETLRLFKEFSKYQIRYFSNSVLSGWYIFNGKYLWHDGTSKLYTIVYNEMNYFCQGYWNTKEEAEEFLRNYLKGGNMNDVSKKLEQAKKDRADMLAKMDANVKELEEQLKESEENTVNQGDKFRDNDYGDRVWLITQRNERVLVESKHHSEVGWVLTDLNCLKNKKYYTKIN